MNRHLCELFQVNKKNTDEELYAYDMETLLP